jgi:hypothetical protein
MARGARDAGPADERAARWAETLRKLRLKRLRADPSRSAEELVAARRSGYDHARHRLAELEAALREQTRLADEVAQQLLPPLNAGAATALAPATTEAPDPSPQLASLLRALQLTLLRHPLAARAAVAGLVAEGRRFAATPEGARRGRELAGSRLLAHARLVWKMASLGSFEDDAPEVLPSAYLEGVLLTAASGDPDRVLDRLFGGTPE